MKHLLEMNHFLPTIKTGNMKKSDVQLDTYNIPKNIREFFSRNDRNLSMISEIHEDGSVDVIGNVLICKNDLIDGKLPIKFGYVQGYFYCCHNQLLSLDGCPREVEGYFKCYNNELASLEGCPKKVEGCFNCDSNQLTSLEGCPTEVGGDFACWNNKLMSLEDCPKEVSGNFYCGRNPGDFTEDDVRQYCKVKGEIKV